MLFFPVYELVLVVPSFLWSSRLLFCFLFIKFIHGKLCLFYRFRVISLVQSSFFNIVYGIRFAVYLSP